MLQGVHIYIYMYMFAYVLSSVCMYDGVCTDEHVWFSFSITVNVVVVVPVYVFMPGLLGTELHWTELDWTGLYLFDFTCKRLVV